MFGKSVSMKHLALRKQLLVAESELNRAQLSARADALLTVPNSSATRPGPVRRLISAAALLTAGLASSRPAQTPAPSRMQMVLRLASLAAGIWISHREQRGRNSK